MLKCFDLHRHIIYQNDPMTKPDFMVMVPDLYRRRRRRQGHRRLPRHPPEPQGHLFCTFANGNLPIDICHSDFRLLDICRLDTFHFVLYQNDPLAKTDFLNAHPSGGPRRADLA